MKIYRNLDPESTSHPALKSSPKRRNRLMASAVRMLSTFLQVNVKLWWRSTTAPTARGGQTTVTG